MRKRVGIAAVILVCVMIGAGWLAVVSGAEKDGPVIYTTLSIDRIAEKLHNGDGYYLTVALEDWLIEDYNLSYDRITFKTEQEVYDKVSPGDIYAGVTLKIREPEKCSNGDIRAVLKWKRNDLCEIVSLGQKAGT